MIQLWRMNMLGNKQTKILLLVEGKAVVVDAQSLSVQLPMIEFMDSITDVTYILLISLLIYAAYKKGLKRTISIRHFEGEIIPSRYQQPLYNSNSHLMGRLTFNLKRKCFFRGKSNQKIIVWFPLRTITTVESVAGVVMTPKTFIYCRQDVNSWVIAKPVLARFFNLHGEVCNDSQRPELDVVPVIAINWYNGKIPHGIFNAFCEECTIEITRDGRAYDEDIQVTRL